MTVFSWKLLSRNIHKINYNENGACNHLNMIVTLGDHGYPLNTWLLTPLTNPRTVQEWQHNDQHAWAWSVIERTIGQLKGGWCCLNYIGPEKAYRILLACSNHNAAAIQFTSIYICCTFFIVLLISHKKSIFFLKFIDDIHWIYNISVQFQHRIVSMQPYWCSSAAEARGASEPRAPPRAAVEMLASDSWSLSISDTWDTVRPVSCVSVTLRSPVSTFSVTINSISLCIFVQSI